MADLTQAFGFREDDFGSTIGTAEAVSIEPEGDLFTWGLIERNTDLDFFEFSLDIGVLELNVDPFQGRPNLDILAKLYNESGVLLDSINPLDTLDAGFAFNVATAGNYYLSIEGTGREGIYSDYGSLGFFTINGSFSAVPEPGSLAIIGLVGCVGLMRRRRGTKPPVQM